TRVVRKDAELAGLEPHHIGYVVDECSRVSDDDDAAARMSGGDLVDGGGHARDDVGGHLREDDLPVVAELEGHLDQAVVGGWGGVDQLGGLERAPRRAAVDGGVLDVPEALGEPFGLPASGRAEGGIRAFAHTLIAVPMADEPDLCGAVDA